MEMRKHRIHGEWEIRVGRPAGGRGFANVSQKIAAPPNAVVSW